MQCTLYSIFQGHCRRRTNDTRRYHQNSRSVRPRKGRMDYLNETKSKHKTLISECKHMYYYFISTAWWTETHGWSFVACSELLNN